MKLAPNQRIVPKHSKPLGFCGIKAFGSYSGSNKHHAQLHQISQIEQELSDLKTQNHDLRKLVDDLTKEAKEIQKKGHKSYEIVHQVYGGDSLPEFATKCGASIAAMLAISQMY